MSCRSLVLVAGLLALASASPCRPSTRTTSVMPTLPTTGTGTDLPAVNTSLSLLKIAVGHGLQNYTCANSTAAAKNTGALAVLYDVTHLYPGTAGTGLSADDFDALAATTLWGQDIPLNLQNPSVASPGTPSVPNAQDESLYGAVVYNSFPEALGLTLVVASNNQAISFLGHHYFDGNSSPTFDLSTAGLVGSMAKTADVLAPSSADTGILDTNAVDWLQLSDNGKGLSNGIQTVYRVHTAGGASEACSTVNATSGSVPYAAMYWFYG